MKKLALIGKDISHSKSQSVYESLVGENVDYQLLDIQREEEIPLAEKLLDTFDGISVTSPYKGVFCNQTFIRENFLCQLGSINCLRKRKGRCEGTSTDFLALEEILTRMKSEYDCFGVALLGDGNMSMMTRFILNRMGLEYKILCRRGGNLAEDMDLERIFPSEKKLVVINSCSREFVFRGRVPQNTLFWDYNYDMGEHEKELGKRCHYESGYGLLKLQAKYSLDFWYN